MPAPVPPGYTRGPILLIGPTHSAPAEATLLQRLWSEAGGYGARLLLLTTGRDTAGAARLTALLQDWESEAVTLLPIEQRQDARHPAHVEKIEQATAILLLDDDPLRLTMRLGGTPVAQALRRANARSKVVAALGAGATALCQHMILADEAGRSTLAPGFGLLNRLGLAVADTPQATGSAQQARLIRTVAGNPFLIGVGLEYDTGIVVYADTTLEVFGKNQVHIVDGAEGDEVDPTAAVSPVQAASAGWQLHTLSAGYTFNFDQRTVHAPLPTDIPLTSVPGTVGRK